MIAVVTGPSGFIGSHLVDRLLREGASVRAITRSDRVDERSRVEVHHVDWRAPGRTLDAAVAGADVVFHLAGVTRARTDADFRAGNVLPTELLGSAIRRADGSPHFVLVSSQAAAGPARDEATPRREGEDPAPVEGYGRSKLDAERVALALAGSTRVTVFRPSIVYGPRDRDVFQLFRLAHAGWSVHPGDRDRWIDVVHVDDVVDALIAATKVPPTSRVRSGTTCFVGHHAVTWRALHEEIARAVGRTTREVDLPDWLVRTASHVGDAWSRVTGTVPLASSHKAALGREAFWLCSNDHAREALGWVPRRALPDGLRETYLWYLEHGWLRRTRSDASDRRFRPSPDHRPAA